MELMPDKKNESRKAKHERDMDEIKKDFKDRVSILAVSYHNLGVEQEFLKMYHEAM